MMNRQDDSYIKLRTGLFSILFVSLILSFLSGCDDPDRNYDDMVPPELPHGIQFVSGVVTDRSGRPVRDATVQIGDKTVRTEDDGTYCFRPVPPGTYVLSVNTNGKEGIERSIVVPEPDGQLTSSVSFNMSLVSSDHYVKESIKAVTGGCLRATTEHLSGNDKAEVTLELEIPGNALAQDAVVSLFPTYDASLLPDGSGMLVGARLEGATFKSAARLHFFMGDELAGLGFVMRQTDGVWTKISSTAEEGVISVDVTEQGYYGFFVPMALTEKTSNKTVTFSKNVWDNIHGAGWLFVPQVNYSYMLGAEIPSAGKTVLTALLIEKMVSAYGAVAKEVADSYFIDVTLPVGVRLSFSGYQEMKEATFTAGNTKVSCTSYGSVNIWGKAVDREDTGGSN